MLPGLAPLIGGGTAPAGSSIRTTSGTWNFVVPDYATSLTIELWGPGGGAPNATRCTALGLTAGGGISGGAGSSSTGDGGGGGEGLPIAGSGGSGGVATGGDVNINGNPGSSGSGFSGGGGGAAVVGLDGVSYGAGSSGASGSPSGGGGQGTGGSGGSGSGAYLRKTYAAGTLSDGMTLSIDVVANGAAKVRWS